jgi:excisionase family DNA binding protein
MRTEPLAIGVKDLEELLGIGRTVAYELVRSEGFPKIRVNKRILIPVDALKEWLAKNTEYGTQRGAL